MPDKQQQGAYSKLLCIGVQVYNDELERCGRLQDK